MNVRQNDSHMQKVDLWENKQAHGLSVEKRIQLFEKAIQVVEQRSRLTLSSVTVMVVINRALFECKEKFPLLSEIKVESKGLNLEGFRRQSDSKKPEQRSDALRYFLIEILTVFGNITADVLTAPLYKALMDVSFETSTAKINRDKV